MKIFSYNFNKYVDLELPLQTIWIEIRPHETLGLTSFDTKHQCLLKTGCIAWDDLNSEDIEIYFVNFTNCPRTYGGHCIYQSVIIQVVF